MKRTNLHLDEADYKRLQEYAEKNSHTVAGLVRRAIKDLLDKLRSESKRGGK